MDNVLPILLGLAVLLPLISFFFILCVGRGLGKYGAWIATSAILLACALSFGSLIGWLSHHWPETAHHDNDDHEAGEREHEEGEAVAEKEKHGHGAHEAKPYLAGDYYLLGQFGKLRVTIGYYIDSLTICMFCMVTLIAMLIHFYAMGYMHEELHDVTDHEVTLSDGSHLTRPGRYPRFFQYLSLFCFSMLGLVLAGNIAMVFVFWELVGICSYFLIGFYVERKSASNAANKAFIVNRVGDFGMIIGLMALWASLGTFAFGDVDYNNDGEIQTAELGIFSQIRPEHVDGHEQEKGSDEEGEHIHDAEHHPHKLVTPAGMVRLSAQDEISEIVSRLPADTRPEVVNAIVNVIHVPLWREGHTPKRTDEYWSWLDSVAQKTQGLPAGSSQEEINDEIKAAGLSSPWSNEDEEGLADSPKYGYWLLIVAGIGIFCGCVGKSAQFPLHVWLPDAMEGPTPVSALVHSATMVAAGVYLVGRFFPAFAPEVLLVIAIVGVVTLFLAATIAITATDIKRVLAYSTISQLGYMMLALGVGGWLAGLMHLITHAFFKSLLFMCSGSVIHAVHTNEMPQMGGLLKKMPVTAVTMLIGCLAIAGASIPLVVGLSGYYSKDAILEQAFAFFQLNGTPLQGVFFFVAAGGAAITAFYMFRLWFMTFVGKPRDQERYDHAHESPKVMYVPLVILSIFAIAVAWNPTHHVLGIPEHVLGALVCLLICGAIAMRFTPKKESIAGAGHDDGQGHHDHGGLSPKLIYLPMVLSAVLLVVSLLWWPLGAVNLSALLEQARPDGTAAMADDEYVHTDATLLGATWPNEHYIHDPGTFATIKLPVTLLAFGTAIGGIALAAAFYWWKLLDPGDVRKQFSFLYKCLLNKWYFDELYNFVFVRPCLVISRFTSEIDRRVIDWLIDNLARGTQWFAGAWDLVFDRWIVDGFVNVFGGWVYSIGLSLRRVQSGRLRQYVMYIVLGTIIIFILISFFWNPALAK